MRLVQSQNWNAPIHAALDAPRDTTLCGRTVGRSSWSRWQIPANAPVDHLTRVTCLHCRRLLNRVATPDQKLTRAVKQLGEVVALAMETGTFRSATHERTL